MATLTGRIREVVGQITCSSGRGMSWFWVGDGRTRTNKQGFRDFLEKMSETFETWKMVRRYDYGDMIDYHFIIRSKSGILLGFAQTNDWREHDDDRFIVVNYTGRFETENDLHEFNRNYENVISYEKDQG